MAELEAYTGQWREGLFDGRGELRAASPRAAQADADARFESRRAALIKQAEVRASHAVSEAMEVARAAATFNPAEAAVQLTMPMAKVIMGSDAPKRATMTMENSSVGKT